MNDPDLFDDDYDIIPDDDYMGDDNDEDSEEIGVDYMSMEDTPDLEDHKPREQENRPSLRPKKHRAKIKPMPPGLLRKMPDVASMLITKTNGKQVLLVNPKVYR